MFDLVELFAQALHESSFEALSAAGRKDLLRRAKSDVLDHMPIWVHILIPGTCDHRGEGTEDLGLYPTGP